MAWLPLAVPCIRDEEVIARMTADARCASRFEREHVGEAQVGGRRAHLDVIRIRLAGSEDDQVAIVEYVEITHEPRRETIGRPEFTGLDGWPRRPLLPGLRRAAAVRECGGEERSRKEPTFQTVSPLDSPVSIGRRGERIHSLHEPA